MKISTDGRFPISNDPVLLKQRLDEIHRILSVQINGLTEGRSSVLHAATDAIPDNAYGADGDFVHKKTKSVTSGAPNYVIQGWDKISGAWVERRTIAP